MDSAWALGALQLGPLQMCVKLPITASLSEAGARKHWRLKRAQTLRMKLQSSETKLQVLESIPKAPSSWPETTVAGGREGPSKAGLLLGMRPGQTRAHHGHGESWNTAVDSSGGLPGAGPGLRSVSMFPQLIPTHLPGRCYWTPTLQAEGMRL